MPILDPHSLEIISRNPDQTRRVGARLGMLIKPGDVISLVGELGTGKTTLVQGIAAGWGSKDQVSSPTFVLVNVYRSMDNKRLYHLDAYRLNGVGEAAELDIESMVVDSPLIVEWADRILGALPEEHLWVSLHWVSDEQRDIVFSARGHRYQELLRNLSKQVYRIV